MLVIVRTPILCSFAFLAMLTAAEEASDPWSQKQLLQPVELSQTLKTEPAPLVISVAFPALYRQRHIVHAVNAGPGSKPEGIAALKKAVAGAPLDARIVIYCGCCPMVKCPNIRPAFQVLRDMGYTNIRVLNVPTNMHTDWYSKDYPSEPGS